MIDVPDGNYPKSNRNIQVGSKYDTTEDLKRKVGQKPEQVSVQKETDHEKSAKQLGKVLRSREEASNKSKRLQEEIPQRSFLSEQDKKDQKAEETLITTTPNEIPKETGDPNPENKPYYPLRKGLLTIGRTPENDVQISSSLISRNHLQVIQQENDFYLKDLNSTNGTQVNGREVSPGDRVILKDRDLVRLGNADVVFKVNIESQDGKSYMRFIEEKVDPDFKIRSTNGVEPNRPELSKVKPQPEKKPKEQEQKLIDFNIGEKTLSAEAHSTHDATFILKNGFIGAFDGVSTADAKDAAHICKQYAHEELKDLPQLMDIDECADKLSLLWIYLQKQLRAKQQEDGKERSTTAAIAQVVMREGKRCLLTAHSGDSRIYVVKRDGKVLDITVDHKRINQDIRMTDTKLAREYQKDQNENDEPVRGGNIIVQALSERSSVKPDFTVYELRDDDIGYFASTDGMHDVLKSSQMQKTLTEKRKFLGIPIDFRSTEERIKKNITKLVDKARAMKNKTRRYKDDDISLAYAFFA